MNEESEGDSHFQARKRRRIPVSSGSTPAWSGHGSGHRSFPVNDVTRQDGSVGNSGHGSSVFDSSCMRTRSRMTGGEEDVVGGCRSEFCGEDDPP